jgi:hypothetical protein
LRRSSRDTVDGARLSAAAIERTDSPRARPSAIASRCANSNCRALMSPGQQLTVAGRKSRCTMPTSHDRWVRVGVPAQASADPSLLRPDPSGRRGDRQRPYRTRPVQSRPTPNANAGVYAKRIAARPNLPRLLIHPRGRVQPPARASQAEPLAGGSNGSTRTPSALPQVLWPTLTGRLAPQTDHLPGLVPAETCFPPARGRLVGRVHLAERVVKAGGCVVL